MTNSQKVYLRSNARSWKGIIFYLLLILTTAAGAQDLERMDVAFRVGDLDLRYPLAGGLNSPQFSLVDLDNDGLPDLHVFDRVGNRQLTFRNNGSTGAFPYDFAPEFVAGFPEITHWMLLRDYNGDGIMDIFAYADQNFDAVMVFTGYYENGQIRFERFQFDAPRNVIYVPRAGGGSNQLYVSTIDYPAVDDVDCDGDLDILTFNLVGGYVELYANQSVERGFGQDSLIYRLQEDCWGGFFESGISNEVDLAGAPGDCVDLLLNGELETRHSGSTLLTFDADGDQDKELILGDISFNSLNFLHNGGNCAEAWMNAQDPNFPATDVPAVVPVFPAAFYLDIDRDGLNDLVVAPNADLNASDREIWWYKNIGTATNADFQLIKKDLLVDEMIDLGSGAHPVFFDYNKDGLLDIVLANYSFYEPFGAKNARIYVYENTGTATAPAFRQVEDDYLDLNQFSQSAYAFTPCFGDLDGDGDPDAVIGEQGGHLFYAENIAGLGNPPVFAAAQYDYMGINVGQASTPQIVDLNRDGLPDLVIGERNGNLNYFQNKGTAEDPVFSAEPDQMVLGGVDARIPGYTTGYAAPVFFEKEGAWQLLIGTETGRLELYDNIDGNLDGTFNLVTEHYGAVREGIRTHPALADLDGDGLLELAVGNFSGGLALFQTGLAGGTPVAVRNRPALLDDLRVWPNPSTGRVLLRLEGDGGDGQLSVFDARGQVVDRRTWNGGQQELQVSTWPSGVYIIRFEDRRGVRTRRLIVE
ncbi:T9SS type A sorting domain-containing protein [Flavilitoribacter nigricans]|uniref:Secretion system C-terminal sorting domain-containing protein n=1 Tax=Flavilitoribacter nigricans (strain ATCC 23147 / DSM 23189 / NBRC 102662 / NCIMB 1420 / SS-2) TaxID=1122177 RepID=A0A2D0ND05_FLAN2|nr:T9SS type A sorting domain-containing protein [Flavilitoribacter nigricans]PHN05653.1 hypothetical protein CRP01_14310 [Flavilitoribacter nigricans DSM 23189 = NBRC 102662]